MTLPELQLTDHFLIAMPALLDPVFGGAVVYICEHNERGALGVVINKPTTITLDMLFERMTLSSEHALGTDQPIMFGGPVQDACGFVLHTPVGDYASSLKVTDALAFTSSRDVLEALASGQGPQRLLISIGYSGWGPGQLENEIVNNGWLTVRADPSVMFEVPIEERYLFAMKLLGVDPVMLMAQAGHA
jgi:putative transcriptional regulator